MRHTNGTASHAAKGRPARTRAGRRVQGMALPRRKPLVAALSLALYGSHAFAAGNNIVVDGRTQTSLQVNGAITNVTTSTVQGGNAFNSFSHFSVGQGNTVNLQVPGAAANLINLVHDSKSVINGVLNAYRNGQIGGNVFFANPYGFVVGSTGVVNVGSLSVSTPSKAFLDQMIGAGGVIDAQMVQQLLNGTAPLSNSGVISIEGKVNALDSISLRGWDVTTSGVLSAGPAAAAQVAAFNGTVNTEGLQQGQQLVANNGVIEIVAGNDATVGGKLVVDGASGVNAGRVNVEAGRNITITGTADVSAKGAGAHSAGGTVRFRADGDTTVSAGAQVSAAAGSSGDGGVVEVSATHSVTFLGGSFDTSARNGKAGLLFVDPTDVTFGSGSSIDQIGDFTMSATNSITVAAGGHIRTVNPNGDSGSVTLTAPAIDISGTIDTSNAGTHKAGDVTLNATNASGQFPAESVSIKVSGLIDASAPNGTPGKVTLAANAESDGTIGIFSSSSTVDVTGTIKGGDVLIASNAYTNVSYDSTPASIPTMLLVDVIGSGLGLEAMVVEAHADSNVTIGGTITSAGDVTISSRIAPKSNMPALVLDLVSPVSIATVYGEVLGTATATVASTAHITTGNTGAAGVTGTHGKLSVTAASDVTLDVRAYSITATTGEYFAGTAAIGKADITTTATIENGADLKIGAVDLVADNQNSFSVKATAGAWKQGVAGLAYAESDLTTNTKASLGASLGTSTDGTPPKLSGNVVVQADSSTTNNVTGSSTDVGTSGGGKILVAAAGGITDYASKKLGLATNAAKGGSGKAGGTTPWKVGSALSINNTTQNVTAEIAGATAATAPVVQANGDVVVHSKLLEMGTHIYSNSSINSSIKDEDKPSDPAAKKAASFALSYADFEHQSDATIGDGVQISAARIGVGAESDMPLVITWDKWEGLSSITDKLNTRLGVEKEVLTSFANANGAAIEGGYFGSVNIFQVDNTANAWVGVNASLTATQATDSSWTTQLITALTRGDGGYTASWSNALTVDSSTVIATANVAGDFSAYKLGTRSGEGGTAVGLSVTYLNYDNTTNAGIGAGAIVTASGVGVNAVSADQAVTVAPTSGSGDGKSINGILALADFDNHTQASISNLSKVEAGNVTVNAQQEVELWTVTGALATSSATGIGVSIAANDITSDTQAFIGDNSDWIKPGSLTVAVPGYVHADTLTVSAGTDGQINALAVSAADVSSDDPNEEKEPGKLDQFKAKLTGLQTKFSNYLGGANTFFGKATAPATPSGASGPPGPQPKAGLTLSGSATVNIADMDTRAFIDGATVSPHTLTAPNDVTVRAVNMTDIISASGAAALTRSKAPTTEKSDAVAGAIAYSSISNTVDAHIANSAVTNVDDVAVQALSGGFEVTVALGLAVNKSTQGQKVRDGAGSVSIAQVDNDTMSYVSDSTVTGMTGKTGQDVEVTAYSQALVATGGGAFYGGGKQSVGIAVSYSSIDNDTDAYVEGSGITKVNGLTVQGLEANTIVGGAAMGGISGQASSESYVGGFVYNEIEQSTSAEIRADDGSIGSTVDTAGDVKVLAKSTKAVAAYESMLDSAVPSSATRDSGISIETSYGDNDMPFGTGNLIIGAAGMLQIGKGENYGLGVVFNKIGNDHTAVIENAGVTSTAGTVNVTAKDESTIIGIAAGVSVSTGAGSSAGIGTASINLIDNTTVARIGVADPAAPNPLPACVSLLATCSTTVSASSVQVNANNESDIWALAGSVAFSSSKSAGAAIGYNETTNTSAALVNAAKVDAGTLGTVTVQGTSSSKIESASVAIAVGQSAISGSLDWNIIKDDVSADVTRSAVKAGTLTVSADQGEGIDKAAIYSLSGAGLGININDIGNEIGANITDSALTVGGAVNVTAVSAADIWAGAGSIVIGGNDSVAFGLATAANNISNTVVAGITNSSLDQAGNVTTVSASDDSNIRSGVIAVVAASDAGGIAIAYNDIDNTVHAFVHGSDAANATQVDYNAKNVLVKASSDADIQTLAAGVALGSNAGAGSTAINLMGTDVTAEIASNAHVKAQNNVGVLARNDDSIAVIAGSLAIGGGAVGIGLSVVVNHDDGDTSAYINGAGTVVDAKGLDTSDKLSVDSGTLVNPLDVGSIAPPTAVTRDMSETQNLVSGLSVVATSHQAVVTNAVTVGISGGSTGIALVPVVNLMGGTTTAYIEGASIDTRLDANPTLAGYNAPAVNVAANSHTYTQNFVVAIAGGPDFGGAGAASTNKIERTTDAHVSGATIGSAYEKDDVQTQTQIVQSGAGGAQTPADGTGTIGSPTDGSTPQTITTTTTTKSLLPAVGAVTVDAKASQASADIVMGGAAGAGAGVGTVIVDLFNARTTASLDGGSLYANSLSVTADSKSGFNALTVAGGLGAGGAVAGAFVVGVAGDTTSATIGNTTSDTNLSLSGALNVSANTEDEFNSLVVSGSIGGAFGVAAMADVTSVENKTTAAMYRVNATKAAAPTTTTTTDANGNVLKVVDGTAGGRFAAALGDVTVSATEKVSITPEAGAGGVGLIGGGVGAGANVVLVKSNVTAEMRDSRVDSSGTVKVEAKSDKSIDATTVTIGAGLSGGLGAGVAVIKVGDGDIGGAMGELDAGSDGTVSKMDAINGGAKLSSDTPNLSATERNQLNTSGAFSVADAINSRSSDSVTASIAGGIIAASTVNVNAQGTVSTSSVIGAAGIGGTLGAGGAVGYTRVYDTVTASATQADITASTLSVTAGLGDGSAGSAVSVDAYAGGAGLVGLGAAVADTQISNTVTASVGGNFTGNAANGATISAIDDTSISAKGIGAAVGAAAVGVVIVDAHKRSAVEASVLADSSVTGYNALTVQATNQGSVEAGAQGAAGGLLAAGTGAEANASNISTVRAFTGSRVALPDGDISILASNSSNQTAEAQGVAVGGLIAASGAIANAWSGTGDSGTGVADKPMITEATLGDANTVSATRGGKLTVHATGVDTNVATAESGAGGVVAGNASIANTSDWAQVTAQVGGGSTTTLHAGSVDVYAEHTDNYSMTGNSLGVSVVGGSGADANHYGNALTTSLIASNTSLTSTGELDVAGRNYFADVNTGDSGAGAGGGVLNGSAVASHTTLVGTVNVTLGDHVKLSAGLDPFDAPANINLVASTVLHHSDEVTLSTGGAIAGADVESVLHGTLNNNVAIGASDELTSQGQINAGTYTQAYASAVALVSTWGLAALGGATAYADVDTYQDVSVGTGAKLTAFDNINLTAGNDPQGVYGTIMIGGASAQGYVRGLIAVPLAYAETKMHNLTSVEIDGGAIIKSGQNVTVGGYRGTLSASADGTGHGYELGFIPVTIGHDKGETYSTSDVTINGNITAGMYHDLTVDIALNPTGGAFTPGITIHDGGYQFTHAYDSGYTLDEFVAGMDPADAAILRSGTSSSPVGAQLFGTMFASGGVVNINGDTSISGGGVVTAYGAPKITVNNASRDYLVLGGAFIPNQPGGFINFTGNIGTAGGITLSRNNPGVAGTISINNTYNTLVNGNVGNSSNGPAMLLTGPVTNLGGLISMTSASGSLGQTGQIFGQTVQMDFPAGVAVISVPGTFTAGGNPISDWSPYMIWPGGNPASGVPSADDAVAWVANYEHPEDRIDPATGQLRSSVDFTTRLIGIAGQQPGTGPHGNNSFVYYGNCATAGAGDCSSGTAASLNSTHQVISQSGSWYYAVVPVVQLTQSLYSYPQSVLDNATRSGRIYGAQVSINARYLDINATISAGQPTNWSVNLPSTLQEQLAYDNFLYRTGAGTIFNVVGTTANAGDSLIGVKYNAQTQQLIVDDVNASSGGGSVKLTGGILSTNPLGKIHVNGGLGQVTINNLTQIPLTLQTINAGDVSLASALSSQVEIVDTLQKIAGGTDPDHWWYVYNPTQGVSVYNNANGATALKNSSGVIIAAAATNDGQYHPRADLRWQWEEVATMSRPVPWHKENGKYIDDGVSHWSWTSGTSNNPWVYLLSPNSTATSRDPQGDNVFIKPNDPAVFEQSISGSSRTGWTWDIYHVGCDGYIGSSCHYGFAQTRSNPDESHWFYNYQTQASLKLTQSVKADNPFAIDFSGNAVGKIAVSSNSPISLNGTLINPNGNTSLTATQAATPLQEIPFLATNPRNIFQPFVITTPQWSQALAADLAGSSITETGTGGIRTGSLTMSASAGIGSKDSAFRATLAPGGVLQADGGSPGVFLNLNSGANIKSVSAGNATVGYGDVIITAAGGLMSGGSGTNVSGRSITIDTTQGSIGSSAAPLVISAHQQQVGNATGGIVNIAAPGNIGIKQVGGDLLVGAITSGSGYIDVAAPDGSILDASGLTAGQALSPEQVQKVWKDLHLTTDYGAEANAIATSVKPLEDRVNMHYGQYLTLLAHGTVSNGAFALGSDPADLALVSAAALAEGKTPQAYAAALYKSLTDSFVADIGPNWATIAKIAARDPTFKYTASDDQVIELTGNAVWSENQLTVAIRKAALDPDPGPRPVGTGVPNIVVLNAGTNGVGDVTLSAGGTIGNLAAPVIITSDNLATGVLNATQQRALALAASPGDVTLTWEDAQHRPVTLDNTGATAVWKDYLGHVMIVAPDKTTPDGVKLVQVAVRQTAPLFVNAPGELDVSAGGGVYLQSSQQIKLGSLQANGPVNLATMLGITAVSDTTPAPQILATGDLSLNAENGNIGIDADHPLAVQLNGGKLLLATAGGNVWITAASGDLMVGNAFAGGSMLLDTQGGSIVADPLQSGLNARAHDLELRASQNIGTSTKPFQVATASDGDLDGSAGGSVWINAPASSTSNTQGSLTIGQFTTGGDLHLGAALDLVAGTLSATVGSVTVNAGRDATLDRVSSGGSTTLGALRNMTLGPVDAGGDVSVAVTTALGTNAATDISSGGTVHVSAGRLSAGAGSSIVAASDAIIETTAGDMSLGHVEAGSDVVITAAGALSTDVLTAIIGGGRADVVAASLNMGAGSAIVAHGAADLRTTAGNMVLGSVVSSAPSGDAIKLHSAGTIAGNGAGQLNLLATEEDAHTVIQAQSGIGAAVLALEVDLPWIQAGTANGGIYIRNRHAFLHLEPVSVGNGSANIATDGALEFSTVAASGDVSLSAANGSLTGNGITAGGSAAATASEALSVQTVQSGGTSTLTAGTDLTFHTVHAGGDAALTAAAGTLVGTEAVSGGSILATAGGPLSVQTVSSATSTTLASGAGISFDTIDAGTSVAIDARAALAGNSITAGTDVAAAAGDALNVRFVTSGGSASLASGGDMTLDTVTAGGDVALDFGGALHMRNLSASSASLSGAHEIVVDNAMVKYGFNLAAPDILAGVTQTIASPPLKMDVTGYHGGIANTVGLTVNAPSGINFGKLWGQQVTVTTPADYVRIADGNVPGFLSLKTVSTNLLMDNADKSPRQVNIQLYEPDFQFAMTLTGKSAFTDAYVLRFDTGYMVGVPNYTESHTHATLDVFGINVIDEATRNSQYRGPLAPTFTPPTGHGPWSVPWTHPVEVEQDGGAVNTSSAERGSIEIARR